MGNKKSSYLSLRCLFENDLTVNHISEDIVACDINDSIEKARTTMVKNGFHCLGVAKNGRIFGYIRRKDVEEVDEHTTISSLVRIFEIGEIVSETTSIIEAMFLLREKDRIFVLEGDEIISLVTRADMQKTPVRLLIFGLISLLEMHFLKIIRIYHPGDSWQKYLTDSRIEKAEEIYEFRLQTNQEIDLLDCLHFCDKRDIILNDKQLFRLFDFQSKNKGKQILRELEKLRDLIAHAQDLMGTFDFLKLISLVNEMEILLRKCEEILENEEKKMKDRIPRISKQ